MTILEFSHEILSESQSARCNVLALRSNEQVEDLLNKAKAIIFAVWQGTGYATTQQVAEYYQVTLETVKMLLGRNEQEFAGEVKKLAGQELQDARNSLLLPSKTSQALAWTPRGMLRAGLILTQSPVAKKVRDVVLNIVESAKPVSVQPQIQLTPLDTEKLIARFESVHALAMRSGNIRLQQQMETAISQYTDVFLLAGLPNQPLVDGQPVGALNMRYEGCVDVAIRLGYRIPSNYEQALGRFVKGRVPHLLAKAGDKEVKDYRTAACSGKRLAAAMYQAFNPEVEQAVLEFCKMKNL